MRRQNFGTITGMSEPVADAVHFQPPTRIRQGMDRIITREVIEDALRRFRRAGGRIRKVRGVVMAVDRHNYPKLTPHERITANGFHEVELVADAEGGLHEQA